MSQLAGLEMYGPMYESRFFELPGEKFAMDRYVDYFTAQGGGSFRESGFEAIHHALESTEWRDGSNTVRAMVLWTDATPRPIGDFTEEALNPLDTSWTGYWSPAYWEGVIGPHFNTMDKVGRETYMKSNFVPTNLPKNMSELKNEFRDFHEDNSNGKAGIKTLTANIINNCWGISPCGDWEDIKDWDGVDVIEETSAVGATDTYDQIVEQVAETVLSQVSARDLAIMN